MIRPATPADLPDLMPMARAFFDASQQPGDFDEEWVAHFMAAMMQTGVILRSDHGFIAGQIAPHHVAKGRSMAIELAWWATDGKGRGLLRAFEEWARENGASEVRMTSLAAIPRSGRLLQAMGYAPVEISHTKEL